MCKGFHHCPSPWWWECSIRNRQLGDKQVDRTNYTNTNTTLGRRASAVNTWKRQKASGSTGQIGMFQLLEWPSGWGRALSKTCHFILFSTPVTPVWKELAVSLPAKGRFFLSLVGLGLHHYYPEQEAYRTKDHQRLQEPEQRSAVLKKNNNNTKPVLKLNLVSQPYTESFQELWETGTMWVNSQLLSSREGDDSVAALLNSWPQLKRQLFSTYGHN